MVPLTEVWHNFTILREEKDYEHISETVRNKL